MAALPGAPLRIAVTRDLLDWGEIGLSRLTESSTTEWEFLPADVPEVTPDLLADFDALLLNAPRLDSETLESLPGLGLVARFGVGFDNVDVQACSRLGVLVTNTPDGVRAPVASSAICLVLALAHQLPAKDRIARSGNWSQRMSFMGRSLDRATVGLVGFGNIGREVARLLLPFGARVVVSDPTIEDASLLLREYSAQAMGLDELLMTSDFVILLCPLTESTFHLIDERRLRMMKNGGYLINLSRGQVVNQSDLTAALRQGWIAGAALDVFEREPVDATEELLQLENVIATPHSICWTDGMAAGCGNSAVDAILAFACGREPRYIVNDSVLQDARYQQMRALRAAAFDCECYRSE